MSALTDVAYPSNGTVAVSGESCFEGTATPVFISHDEGRTFTPQNSAAATTLNSISYAFGTTHGWASGENGEIISSEPNAGAHC